MRAAYLAAPQHDRTVAKHRFDVYLPERITLAPMLATTIESLKNKEMGSGKRSRSGEDDNDGEA